jgi:hypothetical protein
LARTSEYAVCLIWKRRSKVSGRIGKSREQVGEGGKSFSTKYNEGEKCRHCTDCQRMLWRKSLYFPIIRK